REAYRRASVTVRYGHQSAQLAEIRRFDPKRQGRWSFSSQQATLRRLDKAFAAFFRRLKAGAKPGYPRFKGIGHFDTVEFPKDGDGCRWDSTPHDLVTRVRFQGIGHVRVHQHRRVRGQVKTVSVKREGRRWYVVLCADVPPAPLPKSNSQIGIDLGVASFLTTSEGKHIDNPAYSHRTSNRLRTAQQVSARRKRGSARHKEAVAKVAALHRKSRRQRLDHAHKTALALVRDHDLIAHEDLYVAGMMRRPAPRSDVNGGYASNGAAAKSGLNRSIADAGWRMFLAILIAKAESAGRDVIAVNPANTSRTCPECRHVAKENRLSQADFRCISCGHTRHADVVAAINILRAGLALRKAQMG
ncbi:MAG: transposase, partial [Actinobacteria bacterium]|nr:transposase [Actinomycetota bacterium]